MAIVDLQAWSSSVDADEEAVFNRQPLWSAGNDALFYASDGPFGDGAWAPEREYEWLRCDGGWGLSTIYVAMWVNSTSAVTGDRTILLLGEGTVASPTYHVDIQWTGHGFVLRRGKAGTVLARIEGPFLRFDTWHHVACKVVVHDSTGVVIIEVDGEEVVNETGLDTRNGGTSGIIDLIEMASHYQYQIRYAEPIVWSSAGDSPTDFFGLHRVHMIKPDGDTSTGFTTLGAGTNAAEVDEQACDDDTSYNYSATATNKDKLTTESVPTAVNSVYAVQAKCQAKDDAGTDNIKVGLDSGTESLSANQALANGAYNLFEGPLETVDPNTSSQWTETNVNATDVVYEHG